jgi:CubicO group peptidase (beta-lactamase class C family)
MQKVTGIPSSAMPATIVPMKHSLQRSVASALIALLLAVVTLQRSTAQQLTPAPTASDAWIDPKTTASLDALFAVPQGSPGYAVAVIKNGRFVYKKCFGLSNLDDNIPITPDTSFHLASVSKQFTASAIALLILDHKIGLSDSVSEYIPETAKFGADLRIEHLVYMTSGLPEYTDLPRESGVPWMTFYYFTRDEAIAAVLKSGKLEFAPGTQWAYRNTNYMLLTKIVEVVSHESFADFMRERIFRPLGMTHTEINDDSTEVIAHRATGYAQRSDPRVIKELAAVGVHIKPGDGWVRLVRVSPHFGGSGVFTSVNDLLLWDQNWYSGSLKGMDFTELMNRRQKFQHDKDDDAFGLVWRSRYGHPMLDYSGGDTDTSTYMARFPEEHLTVICLSNMPLGDAEGKASALMDVLHAAGKL